MPREQGTQCGHLGAFVWRAGGRGCVWTASRNSQTSPLLQFASTARTSSSRCTRPRGSPGTLCVRTTGMTATGGPRARTWATGECGPRPRNPGRVLSTPPWTCQHTSAGDSCLLPRAGQGNQQVPTASPCLPCIRRSTHCHQSCRLRGLHPLPFTRGCPAQWSPRSKVLAEGLGGSFLQEPLGRVEASPPQPPWVGLGCRWGRSEGTDHP